MQIDADEPWFAIGDRAPPGKTCRTPNREPRATSAARYWAVGRHWRHGARARSSAREEGTPPLLLPGEGDASRARWKDTLESAFKAIGAVSRLLACPGFEPGKCSHGEPSLPFGAASLSGASRGAGQDGSLGLSSTAGSRPPTLTGQRGHTDGDTAPGRGAALHPPQPPSPRDPGSAVAGCWQPSGCDPPPIVSRRFERRRPGQWGYSRIRIQRIKSETPLPSVSNLTERPVVLWD
jgi:hypothetical protein